MPFQIGPSPVQSGQIELKGKFRTDETQVKTVFETKVKDALEDGLLTKTEYKALKDSMVNGRATLNDVLARAGVASPAQLEKIFAKDINAGSVSITPMQRDAIKAMLTGQATAPVQPQATTALAPDVQAAVDELKENTFKPVDRSDPKQKYSRRDFIFTPEISGVFKEFLNKEHNGENIDFLQDVNNALKNPTKENLTAIYNKYVKSNADTTINLADANRAKAAQVFNNPNSSVADMVRALHGPAKEIFGLIGDPYSRFTSSKEMGQAKGMLSEAMLLPAGPARMRFIKALENSPNPEIRAAAKQVHILTAAKVTENIKAMG